MFYLSLTLKLIGGIMKKNRKTTIAGLLGLVPVVLKTVGLNIPTEVITATAPLATALVAWLAADGSNVTQK
jgi:hypothetical protein